MKQAIKDNYLLTIIGYLFFGIYYSIFLACGSSIYKKSAWYTKWFYWVLSFVLFGVPFIIISTLFAIWTTYKLAGLVDSEFDELYTNPLVWMTSISIGIYVFYLLPISNLDYLWSGLLYNPVSLYLYFIIIKYTKRGEFNVFRS